MKFKGDLLITDPCYVKCWTHPLMEKGTVCGDWTCMVYPGKISENRKHDEWRKFCSDLQKDYGRKGVSEDERRELRKKFVEFKEGWKENIIGEFCADSGRVALFDYGLLLKSTKDWFEEHDWCGTVIFGFDGDVDIRKVGGELSVIGTGNKDFFSVVC